MSPSQNEHLCSRLKWYLFIRVILVSFFLGAVAVVYLRSDGVRYAVSINLLQLGIAITYALTIVSAVFLQHVKRLFGFAYAQVIFDILLTTTVIFITGGADSPFGFLYSLVVINAAMLLSWPGAIAAASISSISYAALVLALATAAIPHPEYAFRPAPPDLQFALRFAITNVTFYVIAVLASSLVRRLHETEQLLETREAERDRLATLQEALARHIGSALITTDTEGRITSLNQVAAELIGVVATDVTGQDLGTVFAPLRQTASGRLQFLQSSSSIQPTEFQHHTADGRELTLRCSAVVLQDTYRNLIGALYIVQDVTSLYALEQQLDKDAAEEMLAEEVGVDETPSTDGLTGSSPGISKVRELIEKAAKTDA